MDQIPSCSLILYKMDNPAARIIRNFSVSRFNHWSILLKSNWSTEELLIKGIRGNLSLNGKYNYVLEMGPVLNGINVIKNAKNLFFSEYDENEKGLILICSRKFKHNKYFNEKELFERIYDFIDSNKDNEFLGLKNLINYWLGLNIDYEKEGYSCLAFVSKFIREVLGEDRLPLNIEPSHCDTEPFERDSVSDLIDTIFERKINTHFRKEETFQDSIGISFGLFIIWLIFAYLTFAF